MADFPGPIVPARPASTVIAVRRSQAGFDVLMVRRAIGSEFMGNAYVFPGGSVDEEDSSEAAAAAVRWEGDAEELPWRVAALRELHEEAGIALTDPGSLEIPAETDDLFGAVTRDGGRLDAGRLHWISRWITPEGLPKRFDTRFYLAEVAQEAAVADGIEVFDDTWVSPGDALENGDSGAWDVPFPTRRHLEMLAGHSSIESLLDHARSITDVHGVLPRIVMDDNGGYRVRIPGEPGPGSRVAQ